MKKLTLIALLLCACKKQEIKTKPEYVAKFEMVAPLKNNFCPAALQLAMDRDNVREIEEAGAPAQKYIHCRDCNIGVFAKRKDSDDMQCTYCEKPYPNVKGD